MHKQESSMLNRMYVCFVSLGEIISKKEDRLCTFLVLNQIMKFCFDVFNFVACVFLVCYSTTMDYGSLNIFTSSKSTLVCFFRISYFYIFLLQFFKSVIPFFNIHRIGTCLNQPATSTLQGFKKREHSFCSCDTSVPWETGTAVTVGRMWFFQ